MKFLTRCGLLCLLLAIIGGATVFAQVDASSPKSAMKSLYAAVQTGDASAVQQLLNVPNDPQHELVGAYADLILAGKHLGDIAKQKYPTATNAFAQGTIVPEDSASIDSAEVTVAGNRAQMKLPDRPTPILLQRGSEGWQIVAEDSKATPEHRVEQLTLLRGLTDAMKKSADDIDADKFPTVEEAESAVKMRLSAAVTKSLQGDKPTSKPATQP
jgi:hypothetical protein